MTSIGSEYSDPSQSSEMQRSTDETVAPLYLSIYAIS